MNFEDPFKKARNLGHLEKGLNKVWFQGVPIGSIMAYHLGRVYSEKYQKNIFKKLATIAYLYLKAIKRRHKGPDFKKKIHLL